MLMYNKEAVPLLSVGKKEMGQPYVNTFSSLEPSGSHSLCSFKACTEVSGSLGQSDISSGVCLEQFCSRACISFQDVDHKRKKSRLLFHPSTWFIHNKAYSDYYSWRLTSSRPLLGLQTWSLK